MKHFLAFALMVLSINLNAGPAVFLTTGIGTPIVEGARQRKNVHKFEDWISSVCLNISEADANYLMNQSDLISQLLEGKIKMKLHERENKTIEAIVEAAVAAKGDKPYNISNLRIANKCVGN